MNLRAGPVWLALGWAAFGCAPALKTARLSDDEPLGERERAAQERLEQRRCGRNWSLLFPGTGQICERRTAEGVTLAALGAAELGVAVGVATRHDVSYPGVLTPLVAAEDAYLASVVDSVRTEMLARALPFTPQDSTEELLDAPFNPRALARPDVWGGLLAFLAGDAAVTAGISALEGQRLDLHGWGGRPNLFGRTFAPLPGYALGAAIFGLSYEHVAIAEELTFRGFIASGLSRRYGETAGWLWGALVFGLAHAFNALFLPEPDRLPYLGVAVPFITLAGVYLGWLYRRAGYTLAPSTALHFWYDFLDSFVTMVLQPQSSSLSGRVLRWP